MDFHITMLKRHFIEADMVENFQGYRQYNLDLGIYLKAGQFQRA